MRGSLVLGHDQQMPRLWNAHIAYRDSTEFSRDGYTGLYAMTTKFWFWDRVSWGTFKIKTYIYPYTWSFLPKDIIRISSLVYS